MRCTRRGGCGSRAPVTHAAGRSFPVGYDVDADDDDEEDSDEEDSDEDEEEDGLRPRKKSGACAAAPPCAEQAARPQTDSTLFIPCAHASPGMRPASPRAGVVIKELPAGAGGDDDEEDEEDEEESEDDAPPAAAGRGKPNPADHAKNFLPLSGDKKRPAAAPTTATPPAKKAAPSPAPAAAPAAAAKPAASPAAAGKVGSQFSDGPAGTLGSRKFDNGLEIINLAAGKPDGKVALMGKRCVRERAFVAKQRQRSRRL